MTTEQKFAWDIKKMTVKTYFPDDQLRKLDTPQKKARAYRRLTKLKVLAHYSEGTLRCWCCGDGIIEFLTIDHDGRVALFKQLGGGNEHRKYITYQDKKKDGSYRKSYIKPGHEFYRWLIRKGYPGGYRVLCWNCNHAYHLSKGETCPHWPEGRRGWFRDGRPER